MNRIPLTGCIWDELDGVGIGLNSTTMLLHCQVAQAQGNTSQWDISAL